jgi:hypothetical protein
MRLWIDPASARLTLLNRVSARGALPNQVMLDPAVASP